MEPSVLANLKALITGESGVGKTRLAIRLAENRFSEEDGPTAGVDFKNSSSSMETYFS